MSFFYNRREGYVPIAVPIMPCGMGEAACLAKRAAETKADLIELRADRLYAGGRKEEIMEVLRVVHENAGGIPVIFTVRTSSEGGLAEISGEEYTSLVCQAAGSGCIAFADVEYFNSCSASLAKKIRDMGVRVIMSAHSFSETPPFSKIKDILSGMKDAGADIAKCAFMPKKESDTDHVMAASAWAGKNLGIPYLVISMGASGSDSRVSCAVYGDAFTFGCLPGEASAPGQREVVQLRSELKEAGERRSRGGFLFLTGFMGAGKSSAARRLSKMLDLPVIEMDRLIEEAAGCSIPEIFRDKGEEGFREMETHLFAGLWKRERAIVSTGGGAVLREENRALMHALGTVVHLEVQPETVYKRLSGKSGNRPNLKNRMTEEGIRELMKAREPFYRDACDFSADTEGKNIAEVAEEICGLCSDNFVVAR